jgi:hypothetical protein
VYVLPSDEYMKSSKGNIEMRNFDGYIGYKDEYDFIFGGYKVKNGRIESILLPKLINRNNLGRDDPFYPNLMDEVTVTDVRPTSLWSNTYSFSPVSSSSSSSGPNLGSNGSSTGGGSGSSTGSTGAAAGDSPYSEVVIPSYLYQSRNPQDVLSEMGLTPIEVTYLTVKNRRVGIQVGEAIDALGLEESKATIKVFTNLIRTNTPFKLANIASYYDVNVILSLDKYLKAGFTAAEWVKLWLDSDLFAQVDGFLSSNKYTTKFLQAVRNNNVFDVISTFLAKSQLSQADKYNSLSEYLSSLDFSKNISAGNSLNGNGGEVGDPELNLEALIANPKYLTLNTEALRNLVKGYNPSLEQYQINISAGVALENAYGLFAGYTKGWNMLASPSVGPYIRLTRPDFIHKTEFYDQSTGKKINFGLGGIIEVKAPSTTLSVSTNNYQIAAEIAFAQYARGDDYSVYPLKLSTYAFEKKAGAYTLVVPYGTSIDPDIEIECTKAKVNFYISYAFIGTDGKIVFSNPKRQNFISNEKSPSPGNINNGADINFEKATIYWKNIDEFNKLKDDSNE